MRRASWRTSGGFGEITRRSTCKVWKNGCAAKAGISEPGICDLPRGRQSKKPIGQFLVNVHRALDIFPDGEGFWPLKRYGAFDQGLVTGPSISNFNSPGPLK